MINHRDERIAMMRFFVEIHRVQSKTTGGDMTAASILWIVALGHMEDRPFNASTISTYLDIPRTTVIRKLRDLRHAGMIEQRGGNEYFLSVRAETMPEEDYAKVAYAIHFLGKQVPLPNMDMAKTDTSTSDTENRNGNQGGRVGYSGDQ